MGEGEKPSGGVEGTCWVDGPAVVLEPYSMLPAVVEFWLALQNTLPSCS